MQVAISQATTDRFARCIAASKRVRWDIDDDVIRNRTPDTNHKFLPDGLSLVDRIAGLNDTERRLLSQIQGRTYANIFGLVERFICAKVLEMSRDYWFGDQTALEALIRFCDEELKHQELFRRVESLVADAMPAGYRFLPDPDEVAGAVMSKSTWAVLALTLHIELFTQQHYRESIEPDSDLSALFKDIFLFHWKEESQHAIMDELEWIRFDEGLNAEQRDRGVEDFIDLVCAVDGILQVQAGEDVRYFTEIAGRGFSDAERADIEDGVLRAYRWQYILSGAQHPHFLEVLTSLTTPAQINRITAALSPLM